MNTHEVLGTKILLKLMGEVEPDQPKAPLNSPVPSVQTEKTVAWGEMLFYKN